jgi:glycosyltransferase involved in cell wall biosynthesis
MDQAAVQLVSRWTLCKRSLCDATDNSITLSYILAVRQTIRQRLDPSAAISSTWPAEPLRVALVITDLDPGGAERAIVSLARNLNRDRWQPLVFCLDKPGQLVADLLDANVPCQCLSARRRRPAQAVFRLARALRRFKPPLVQSFMFHANVAARLAAPFAGFPWLIGGLRVAEHQKRWHLMLDRLTSGWSTGSVCVSRGVLRFSRDVGRLDPARLTVVPNGVDLRRFEAAKPIPRRFLGIPDHVHLALYVGRLDQQKGLPDLLNAAEAVISRKPDWHLALAGDGPCRDWLIEQIATRALLRANVHWLGRRDDIPNVLKSANVMVHASLWEGMPNSVLEAMAAGLPVIGTRVEGTEDLIVPGLTGWLVPPHEPEALANALSEAVESPELLKRYGEAGCSRAKRHFSLEAMVAAYESLWAGVLGYQLHNIDTSEDHSSHQVTEG